MEFSTNFWWDLLDVAIFSSLGIILMLLGNFLIDLIIPCSFPEEIKKRNKSVGFVSAGINIGVGLLLRAAISPGNNHCCKGDNSQRTSRQPYLFCYRYCFLYAGLYRGTYFQQTVQYQ